MNLKRMTIEAVLREYDTAIAALVEVRCAQAGAKSSWYARSEFAGFQKDGETIEYDVERAAQVQDNYEQTTQRIQKTVDNWRAALLDTIKTALPD